MPSVIPTTPEQATKKVLLAAKTAMERLTQRIVIQAKANTSGRLVNIRSGELNRSIEGKVEQEGYKIIATISAAQHGLYMEKGTRPHLIIGRPGLRFELDGRIIWAARVQHPGTAPHPWLSDAVSFGRKFLPAELNTALREVVITKG